MSTDKKPKSNPKLAEPNAYIPDTHRSWHSLTATEKMFKLQLPESIRLVTEHISLDYRLEAQSRFPLLYRVTSYLTPEHGFDTDEIVVYTSAIIQICLLPKSEIEKIALSSTATELDEAFIWNLTSMGSQLWIDLSIKLSKIKGYYNYE